MMGERPPESPRPGSGSEKELPVTSGDRPSAAPAASRFPAVAVAVGFAIIPLLGVGVVGCVVLAVIQAWIEGGGFNSVGPYERPSGPAHEAKLERLEAFAGVVLLGWCAAAAALGGLAVLATRVHLTGAKVAVCLAAWTLPLLWAVGAVLFARATW
jgi:hypothetical protein